METHDCFIMTGEYRDERDHHEIRLYGRAEGLGAVALVFTETKPVFFVDREEKLPALDCRFERKQLGKLTSMSGRPVDGLYFNSGKDLRTAADRFKATGVRHYEADVRPVERFLMERFINGRATIAGEGVPEGGLTVFTNPKIKAAKKTVALQIASLDIETGARSGILYSIAVHLTGQDEERGRVFMLGDARRDMPENLAIYPSERDLLSAFFAWFREQDPDIIIGWYVIGFDLMFLEQKCRDLGLELDLARDGSKVVLHDKPGAGYFATIAGRQVVDGIPALRHAGYTFTNYKLETVARELLDTGKLITQDGVDKIAEIDRQFREDKPALARYNMEDCVLVSRIFEKVSLIPYMQQRCLYSGLMMDQLGIGNAALDHYYLPKLHRKGMVAPNPADEVEEAVVSEGAADMAKPGHYRNVVALEMVNIWPSLIRVFRIDPLALARAEVEPVLLPGGYRFSGTEHLLPALFERLMQRWEEARKSNDAIARKALEVQMQAHCKALRAKTNRFYNPTLPEALASVESWLVGQSRKFLEERQYIVAAADAEMIFVVLKAEEVGTAAASGQRLAEMLTAFWQDRLSKEFGYSSIEVAFGGHFSHYLVPHYKKEMRRYAGLMAGKNGEKLLLEGLDGVVSGRIALAESFREQLFTRFFAGEKMETWLPQFEGELRQGTYDTDLAYRKRIRKKVSEYAQNAPPHIRAARMLDKPGREVTYVWTLRGPVPVALEPKDFDYDHYIQKQIAPIANLVLGLRDKTWDTLTEPEQISLF